MENHCWSSQRFSGTAPFSTKQNQRVPQGHWALLNIVLNDSVNESGSSSCLGLPLQCAGLGQLRASPNANQANTALGTKSRALVLPAAARAKASRVDQQLLLGKVVFTPLFTEGASEFTTAGLGPFALFLISFLISPYYSVAKPAFLPLFILPAVKTIFLAWSNSLEYSSLQLQLWWPQQHQAEKQLWKRDFASTNREDFWSYLKKKKILRCSSKR